MCTIKESIEVFHEQFARVDVQKVFKKISIIFDKWHMIM